MVKEKAQTTFAMIAPVAWIAFAAGLQILGAFIYFKTPFDLIILITGMILTFCIYFINRFTDDEDNFNCPEQKIFFQKKSSLIIIPIILLVITYVVLGLTNRLGFWHFVLLFAGILYSINIIPVLNKKSIRFIRLKDITFLKNIIVSILWGLTPFAFAISLKHVLPHQSDVLVIIGAFCLTVLINSTSTDVRDIVGDRIAGITTFANYFGKKITLWTLLSLGAISCAFVAILFQLEKIGIPSFLFFLMSVTWSLFAVIPIYSSKFHFSKAISEPINDSLAVFNGIGLILIGLIR